MNTTFWWEFSQKTPSLAQIRVQWQALLHFRFCYHS